MHRFFSIVERNGGGRIFLLSTAKRPEPINLISAGSLAQGRRPVITTQKISSESSSLQDMGYTSLQASWVAKGVGKESF